MGWLSPAVTPMVLREASYPFALGNDPDLYGSQGLIAQGFRRLTSRNNDRDLQPLEQERMIRIAAWLFESNPLAKRLIRLLNDYIVGEGFTYKVKGQNPPLEAVLDEYWNDWLNDWPNKQAKRFQQLSIFGEAAYPIFVDARTKRIQIGYIDPMNIKAVVANPNNVEELRYLVQKTGTTEGGGVYDPPPLRIVYQDQSGGPTEGRWQAGEGRPQYPAVGVFYAAINNFTNSTRGRSDLLASFDYLDTYDSFLFKQAERANRTSDVLWDVTIEGSTVADQREWLKENQPPEGPSLRVHNEKVTWDAKTANLASADVSEMARIVRMQAVIEHGPPEHWLFTGSETNRATAAEMDSPFLKYLSKRQREPKLILQRQLEFVRDQAILSGRIPRTTPENEVIEVNASEVSARDLSKMAITAKDITAAAMVAEQNHYLTHEEAAAAVRRVFSELGTDLAPTLPAEVAIDQGIPPEALGRVVQAGEIARTAQALGREMATNGAPPR